MTNLDSPILTDGVVVQKRSSTESKEREDGGMETGMQELANEKAELKED